MKSKQQIETVHTCIRNEHQIKTIYLFIYLLLLVVVVVVAVLVLYYIVTS